MRTRIAVLLVATLFAACREPSQAPSGPSEPSPSSTSLEGAPSDPSASGERSAQDVARAALENFAFPPIHGTVLYEGEEADLVYEIWVQDPAIRVEATLGGETVAWISDGERSSIEEPHLHAGVLFLVDPRQDFLYSCSGPTVLGSMLILDRSATGLGCTGGSNAEYRFDDLSGLVLGGRDAEGIPWRFTELEFDPIFPPDAFDLGAA